MISRLQKDAARAKKSAGADAPALKLPLPAAVDT